MSDPATRPYRIELPNLVDDLDLSPYAFRLYVHIKRVAGVNGSCYEGGRKLAERCRMSTGQVSAAKKELIEKGLIVRGRKETRGGFVDEFTPVDLWQQNYDRYCVQSTNTNDDESVHTVNTNTESVHTVNVSVHQVNGGVHTVNVRKNIEERTNKKRVRAPKQATLDQFNEACQIAKDTIGKKLTPGQASSIAETVHDIPRWTQVVTAWDKRYGTMNVEGLLDWYEHPEKMDQRNGYRNGSSKLLRQSPGRTSERKPQVEADLDKPF